MNRPQPVRTVLPLVTSNRLAETRAFWVGRLGFRVTHDDPHYLGLCAGGPGSPELGFMAQDAEAPQVFGGQGLAFACSVADADLEHTRLLAAGVPIADPIADRPWGTRAFCVHDPNGIAVWLSHPLAAPVDRTTTAR